MLGGQDEEATTEPILTPVTCAAVPESQWVEDEAKQVQSGNMVDTSDMQKTRGHPRCHQQKLATGLAPPP